MLQNELVLRANLQQIEPGRSTKQHVLRKRTQARESRDEAEIVTSSRLQDVGIRLVRLPNRPLENPSRLWLGPLKMSPPFDPVCRVWKLRNFSMIGDYGTRLARWYIAVYILISSRVVVRK